MIFKTNTNDLASQLGVYSLKWMNRWLATANHVVTNAWFAEKSLQICETIRLQHAVLKTLRVMSGKLLFGGKGRQENQQWNEKWDENVFLLSVSFNPGLNGVHIYSRHGHELTTNVTIYSYIRTFRKWE